MGAQLWMYFVPYQEDISKALQELRNSEFAAGRYYPVMMHLFKHMPIGPTSPAPGARHASIQDAVNASDATGSRSILDMQSVSDEPKLFAVCPMATATLKATFGTVRPTHEMAENNLDFVEDLERGEGVYAIIYKGDMPDEILFAGYSFD
jgi:hypothetical protein